MDKFPDQKRAVQYLYPPIDPFDQRMMDVGEGHRSIWNNAATRMAFPLWSCMAVPAAGAARRCGAISIRDIPGDSV